MDTKDHRATMMDEEPQLSEAELQLLPGTDTGEGPAQLSRWETVSGRASLGHLASQGVLLPTSGMGFITRCRGGAALDYTRLVGCTKKEKSRLSEEEQA